ncbi:protease complex subunit PrcB family protein [Halomonadaceae bacterium KBTZ08]
MVSRRLLGLCLLVPLLVGCQAGQAEKEALPDVEVIGQASQCHVESPGLALVRSKAELPEVDRLMSSAQGALQSGRDVVIVYLGQRPTPGYGGELRESEKVGGSLSVALRYTEPDSDAMLAQVITTPCLALSVPGEGWSTLSVRMDAEGFPLRLEAPAGH